MINGPQIQPLPERSSDIRFISQEPSYTGRIQIGILTKVPDNFLDLLSTNRISIGKMALEFLHNFNTSLLVNIWQSKNVAIILQPKPVLFIVGYFTNDSIFHLLSLVY